MNPYSSHHPEKFWVDSALRAEVTQPQDPEMPVPLREIKEWVPFNSHTCHHRPKHGVGIGLGERQNRALLGLSVTTTL